MSGACVCRQAGKISQSQQTAARSQKTQVPGPKIEASPINKCAETHAGNTLLRTIAPCTLMKTSGFLVKFTNYLNHVKIIPKELQSN